MFYVFNREGQCIAKSDLNLNEDDLATRDEIAIKSDVDFINPILDLIGNKIIEKGLSPSKHHQWNGKAWVISPEKMTALLQERRETVRAQINAKRDACVDGGAYVAAIGKWVDSDEKGRATLVEIKADFDLNGKDNTYTLICADNTAKTLNFEEFKAVWDAVKTLKEKMFENAYMHKILLEQAENPLEYDWSIGWSETYDESKQKNS